MKATAAMWRSCMMAVRGRARAIGDIRMPAVVVGGDARQDRLDRSAQPLLRARVPGAELIVLPGIGHMPQYATETVSGYRGWREIASTFTRSCGAGWRASTLEPLETPG